MGHLPLYLAHVLAWLQYAKLSRTFAKPPFPPPLLEFSQLTEAFIFMLFLQPLPSLVLTTHPFIIS